MRDAIISHFQRADPILYQTIQFLDLTKLELETNDDYFVNLISSVVNQQLSEKAGSTIWNRFTSLAADESVTADFVDALAIKQIRSVGISKSKALYIKNIALAAKQGVLQDLKNKSDDEVKNILTRIKGVGPWTAEMFLMFSLGRQDIFSFGDIGLQNAVQKLYGLSCKPDKDSLKKRSDSWRPYRTYACRVLWIYLDTCEN